MKFRNRTDAGQRLALHLTQYAHHPNGLVLALPRGGVPVAFEIARHLSLPLDVCLVRKLGVPNQPELAMGAIASNQVMVLNDDIIESLAITPDMVQHAIAQEEIELERRNQLYRCDRAPLDVSDRTLIVVDDGIATGATLRAAIAVLHQQHPHQLIVAVPVAPFSTYEELKPDVDAIVCLATPRTLGSISMWYQDFGQTSDAEVQLLMEKAQHWQPAS